MNTAHHAGRILNAWQTANFSALQDALNGAERSCQGVRFMNRLEHEKQELLACVVEHLQTLDFNQPTEDGRCLAGATVLLAHLSSGSPEGHDSPNAAFLTTKTRFPN